MRYMTLGLFIFCPFLHLKTSCRLHLPVTIQPDHFFSFVFLITKFLIKSCLIEEMKLEYELDYSF